MEINNIFSFLSLIVYLIIFLIIYVYVKKMISEKGFNIISMFVLTYTLFYFLVPFIQTFFKLYRDETSIFTRVLNQLGDEELFLNLLISFACLALIVVSYHLNFKGKNNEKKKTPNSLEVPNKLYKKIHSLTDIIFIIGVSSIMIVILDVGSLSAYLSLGSVTRGINKSTTDYISSSSLQFVTLSTVILIPPYLYLYIYRLKKKRIAFIKFIFAMFFAILFLLYNQGRAPLVIFFLPFLFLLRNNGKKKQNFTGLIVLFVTGLILLSYLDGLFNYISYGEFYHKESNLITDFLSEFSYPFTNFSIRNYLIETNGFRNFYDYIIWPFTMIPSGILSIFGFNKELIVSLTSVNTAAYGYLLGVNPSGGVPVDFLTVHYYQFGYLSLILVSFISGRLLKYIDNIFLFFNDYFAIKIVLYRISFSVINIVNNSDLSAIIRNRLDVVLLLIILIYIYKNYRLNENLYKF
ncbi:MULTISPECIES: O-antigen polymerase [Clostridia]|uniref:O-antigen polymerase n=1 Tax=Clostridia TaxID=186801 RepID=UPI000EA1D92E|nr:MULTISPECIES: O-antigen polymerase [Clostridia]NBJ70847.1 O-antigen polysaccharide polymerase Wzy [Roseburia sp. 1XD42-34]RKI75709.1 O-antigen polysaccharide polymerase Wzy [Clostridium sp. 1xD42-85]